MRDLVLLARGGAIKNITRVSLQKLFALLGKNSRPDAVDVADLS